MQPTPSPQPSTPALRPLGVGDVIDRVFALYRARALGLFVLGEVLFIGVVVAWIILGVVFAVTMRDAFVRIGREGANPAALATSPALLDLFGPFLLIGIIGWLVTLLVGAVLTGAVVDAASAAHLGKERSIASSLVVGFHASLRIFFTGLLATIAVTLVGVVFQLISTPIENALLLFLISLVYFFAIFFIQASWFVSPVVATVEGHGPISSLRRSWQLAGGFRWRIVGLFLLPMVIFLVLLFLVLFVIGIVAATNQSAGVIAAFIALFAAIPLWMPLFFGTMTVLYYDLRVRKEGLDLQLAAEAMPRA